MTEEKKDLYYNNDLKEEFLNEAENSMIKHVLSLPLRKAKDTETLKNKDLYEMSREEIGEVMFDLASSSTRAAYNNLIRIEEYIKWTISKGYRSSNILPLEGVDRMEWARQFASPYKTFVFNRKEIEKMVGELVNYSDKALFLCLFEGIGGTGNVEIINMRIKDITEKDGQNYATLYSSSEDRDEGKSRTIPISTLLASILHRTDTEKEYIAYNGMDLSKYMPHSLYEESPMIFKKMKRGTQGGSLTGVFVNRRFDLYKEVFDNGNLVTGNIKNSGIMHMANELYKRDGEFRTEHLQIIGEHFNTSLIKLVKSTPRDVRKIMELLKSKEYENLYGYKLINN